MIRCLKCAADKPIKRAALWVPVVIALMAATATGVADASRIRRASSDQVALRDLKSFLDSWTRRDPVSKLIECMEPSLRAEAPDQSWDTYFRGNRPRTYLVSRACWTSGADIHAYLPRDYRPGYADWDQGLLLAVAQIEWDAEPSSSTDWACFLHAGPGSQRYRIFRFVPLDAGLSGWISNRFAAVTPRMTQAKQGPLWQIDNARWTSFAGRVFWTAEVRNFGNEKGDDVRITYNLIGGGRSVLNLYVAKVELKPGLMIAYSGYCDLFPGEQIRSVDVTVGSESQSLVCDPTWVPPSRLSSPSGLARQ